MEHKPSCPFCGIAFDIPPKRKRACPSCGNVFYVRNSQNLLKEKLFKYVDAVSIDTYENYKLHLETLGFGRKKYYEIEKVLEKQHGKKPNPSKAIWELLKEASKQDHAFYYGMAIFLGEIGRNPNPVLERHAKSSLLEFKRKGVRKVEILSDGSGCDSCNNQRKFYTIVEALDLMPIPNKNCTNRLFSEDYSFCRCLYLANLD